MQKPALIVALCSLALTAVAQPKLTSLSSQWIQRGTSMDLKLSGDRLHSVTGVVFSGEAGLSATVLSPPSAPAPNVAVESESGAFSVTPPSKTENRKSLVIRLTAATNATLGARELRVVGPSGISEPRTINLGALAELTEAEPNNTIGEAQAITLPATLNGVISGATEIDCFKFKAGKGETVVLDVDAAQRGSPLDSTLAIFDSAGKELARSEDVNGFDSLLHFTAPDTGEFIAQLRDFQYRGGGNYSYRMHAGVLPYVESVFPFGGQRGKPVTLTLTGNNISGAEKMTLNIDAKASLGRQEIRLNLPHGFSSPIAFDVQDLPEITEVATNATNVITVPGIANGRIEAAKDIDYFTFKADADQKIVAEAIARRFGSPLDALLAVYANGSLLVQNDDTTGTGADARVEFDAKKGTEYVIRLRDLTERGGNEFTYRLSLRPPQPSFTARFYPDAVRIHRGGLARIHCEVQRSGFDGPITFTPENFPAGIIAEPLIVPAGSSSGTLVMLASAAANLGTELVKMTATAKLNGKPVTTAATPVIVADKSEKVVKQGFLTVLPPAPFSIDPITLSAVVDQEQSTTLEWALVRHGDFSGDIKVALEGFSLGRDPITKSLDVPPVTVKGAETTAKLKLRAKTDSEIGTRQVFARAEWVTDGETNIQYSAPVPVTVAQIPFVLAVVTPKAFLTLPRAGATSSVEEVTVKIRADRRGYTGEIPLTLEGMPEGVSVADAKVPAGAGEAAIRLKPTDKAKPGTNYNFKALGVATHNDRIYRHKSGAVKLFIEAPAIEIAASTNAPAAAASK